MNRFFCLQAKSRRLQIYTVLMAISGLLSTILQFGSRLNAKTRTQMLYQYLSPLVKMLKDTPDTPAGAYEALVISFQLARVAAGHARGRV